MDWITLLLVFIGAWVVSILLRELCERRKE